MLRVRIITGAPGLAYCARDACCFCCARVFVYARVPDPKTKQNFSAHNQFVLSAGATLGFHR